MNFVLHIDPVKVDREFKTMERSISSSSFNPMVTKLEDLRIHEKSDIIEPDIVILSDKLYFYAPLYKELHSSKKLMDNTSIPCFYCTEPFSTKPLGIPIQFVPSIIMYQNEDKSISQKYISTDKELENAMKKGLKIVHKNYFEVDGNFCSFSCMLSFVALRENDYRNKDVNSLMRQMHYKLFKTPLTCKGAPDIRLLKKFGGHMSIQEFRSNDSSYHKSISYHHCAFSNHEIPNLTVPVFPLFQYHGNKLG